VSVQTYYSIIDDLLKADDRPDGITVAANVARIRPIFQQIVDSSVKTNRGELNSIYPALGDHLLDDAVVHARFMLQAIDTGDDDALTRAMAAIIRWKKWSIDNKRHVTSAILNKYG
jgi:hypothetical protein